MRSIALFALLCPAVALAVPGHLTHTGRLSDSGGAPVTGAQDLTVALYTEASGGTPVWTDTFATVFDDGFFAVNLGANTPLDAAALNVGALYVGLSLGSDPELSPRLPVNSVPFALHAGSVAGGPVDATSVTVNGQTVINGDGTIDFSRITGAPADADTLGNLSCATDQVVGWNGSAWACTDVASGPASFDASAITSGTVAYQRLPVGSSADTIAAGDHTHAFSTITGQAAFSQLPVGTTADSVAAGNHTHTAAEVGALALTGGTLTGALVVNNSVKVGATTATCNTAAIGTLRAADVGLQVCLAGGWSTILTNNGSGLSADQAARSCLAIKAAHPSSPTGRYWLDPNGGPAADAVRTVCDMTTDGGGWTLAAKVTDDYGWIDTGDYGNLFHANNAIADLTDARATGAGSGVHLPNDQIRGAFQAGNKQVRFAFWDNAISTTQASDDAFATFTSAKGNDLFDDTKIVDTRLSTDYTWTKIRHTKAVNGFDGGIVCWGNQNGQAYRSYEHGLFMGHSPSSGCHLVNDTTKIQMKAHYGGSNGTNWYIQNNCGSGRHGHSMLGTCSPLQVVYSAIYVWVR